VSFGIDSVIGLVPAVGDLITGALGLDLAFKSDTRKLRLLIAHLGKSKAKMARPGFSQPGID
jgi:hypothetical protein